MKRFWLTLAVFAIFAIGIPLFAQAKSTVTASTNPVTIGTSVTLIDTLTGSGATPTGTVSFYNGTTLIQTTSPATLANGVASCVFSTIGMMPGSYNITAVYSGDSVYAGGTKP